MNADELVDLVIAGVAGGGRRSLVGKRVWELVQSELGTDPAIGRLVAEARTPGEVSYRTRAEATQVLHEAADRDAGFAERLGAAADSSVATDNSGKFSGNTILSTGPVTQVDRSKVITKISQHPKLAGAGLLVLLVLVAVLGKVLIGHGSGPSDDPVTAMAGTWRASDGSGSKVFSSSGTCRGFFYNGGEPLDIGGPMTCTLDTTPDAQGRYGLTVVQSPNEANYKVGFDSGNQITVYTTGGKQLYRLTRG